MTLSGTESGVEALSDTAFSWGRSKLPISGAPLVWAPLAVVGL